MRKKLITAFFIMLFSFTLSSCDLTFEFPSASESKKDETILPIITAIPQETVLPTEVISSKTESSSSNISNTKEESTVEYEDGIYQYTFENYLKKDGPFTTTNLPSIGNSKMLVIPVDLLIDKNNNANLLNEINIAFNGTNKETGFRSVKTFYQESSYNKLNLDITVLNEWFVPKYNLEYYTNKGIDGSTEIFKEALVYYDKQIDFSNFDSDHDGYIDSIWLIYNAPVDFDEPNDMLWAYVQTGPTYTYDGKKISQFAFAGTDFMHTDRTYFDVFKVKVDAHTYIHETGHLMGLDDYYDYDQDNGQVGGMYSLDMMDSNVGDHSPASKLLLGWLEPLTIFGKGEFIIDLSLFSETGECILLTPNPIDDIYEEFFIVEFFETKKLNSGITYLKNAKGIRITHVDAHKNLVDDVLEYNGGVYQSGFKYDNSDTEYLFCNTLRADYNSQSEFLDVDSFFTVTGPKFGLDSYNNYKLHDGTDLFFNLKVIKYNIDGTVRLKITKK